MRVKSLGLKSRKFPAVIAALNEVEMEKPDSNKVEMKFSLPNFILFDVLFHIRFVLAPISAVSTVFTLSRLGSGKLFMFSFEEQFRKWVRHCNGHCIAVEVEFGALEKNFSVKGNEKVYSVVL